MNSTNGKKSAENKTVLSHFFPLQKVFSSYPNWILTTLIWLSIDQLWLALVNIRFYPVGSVDNCAYCKDIFFENKRSTKLLQKKLALKDTSSLLGVYSKSSPRKKKWISSSKYQIPKKVYLIQFYYCLTNLNFFASFLCLSVRCVCNAHLIRFYSSFDVFVLLVFLFTTELLKILCFFSSK